MARRKKQNGAGDNSQAQTDICKEVMAEMDSLEAERAGVNARLAACRARLKQSGLNVKAVKVVRMYKELTEDQQAGWDDTLRLTRDVSGLPLFQAANSEQGEAPSA